MDKKLKAKWVKALRSGKYAQCTGQLYDGKGYCCLGVLQRVIYSKNPPASGWDTVPSKMRFIEKCAPDENKTIHVKLAELNDGSYHVPHQSFAQIADYIEAKL